MAMPEQSIISETLPPNQEIEAAWYGAGMTRWTDDWTVCLSGVEIDELEDAMRPLADHNITIADITPEVFPLPSLNRKIEGLYRDLIHGRGFAVVRGLPTERYSEYEASIIFFGLGCHLGHARSQNAQGDVLGHVRDLGMSSADPTTRVYQTRERQTFHTDSSDVVALMCLRDARVGGDSMLVSGITIFNEMRNQRPDLLVLLFEFIATDRRGEVPTGMKPYYQIPVFTWYDDNITTMYQRQYIDSAQRFPNAPRLTPRHVEALDFFDELANDPALHIAMRLQPGDMQFVYDHTMLHDRTAFEDRDEPERQRHLLRLWLSMPGDRRLHPCFAERFGSTEIGNRGGIIAAD